MPFTRHAQFTRLWGEHTSAEMSRDTSARDDENENDANAANETGDETDVARLRVFDAVGDAVAFVASQPGAGKTLLRRRNQKICTGEWLNDVSWAPVSSSVP